MKNTVMQQIANIYQEFFNFMIQEHDLILTVEEMDEILYEARKLEQKLNESKEKLRFDYQVVTGGHGVYTFELVEELMEAVNNCPEISDSLSTTEQAKEKCEHIWKSGFDHTKGRSFTWCAKCKKRV